MFEEITNWIRENAYLIYRYLAAVATVLVFYYASKIASRPISKLKVEMRPEVVHNLERGVRAVVLVIGVLTALSIVGVDLGGFLIAAGFTGIVIGLAAQQTLGNFFAGLALLLENRIKVGDSVRIGNDGGVVEYVGIMSTRVRLWSGEVLTVPNSSVMGSSVYNFSRSIARRAEINVGISYESDVDKAVRVIREVLRKSELVLAEPEPSVLIDSLGDNSVNLRVLFWAPSQDFWAARSFVIKEIKKALEAEGIEIPLPQRVVRLIEQARNQVLPVETKSRSSQDLQH
ncbi:MAG: mechanosensitive ion channel family protein [Sulfolobales archaeon]